MQDLIAPIESELGKKSEYDAQNHDRDHGAEVERPARRSQRQDGHEQ